MFMDKGEKLLKGKGAKQYKTEYKANSVLRPSREKISGCKLQRFVNLDSVYTKLYPDILDGL